MKKDIKIKKDSKIVIYKIKFCIYSSLLSIIHIHKIIMILKILCKYEYEIYTQNQEMCIIYHLNKL